MLINLYSPWALFCLAFGLMLLGTYLMGLQGQNFITMDPVRRNVSVFALEFPSTGAEIANIMRGIFLLPEKEKQASLRSVKMQLITDYLLFMPGAYGGIFIMCWRIADKMSPVGHILFTGLAWAQVLCFVLDAIENAYFWSRIRPDVKAASDTAFRLMQALEITKWGLSLLGAVCGFSAITYFWLSGYYQPDAAIFVGVFFLEIIVFLMAGKNKAAKKERVLGK